MVLDSKIASAEKLKILLTENVPYVKIIDEAWDRKSFNQKVRMQKPDVLFSDIDIGEETIFDILAELEEISFDIVLYSYYDYYGLTGYKYNVADYLLKPICVNELLSVCEKLLSLKKMKALDTFTPNDKGKNKISIKGEYGIHIIDVTQVLYCRSEGNYTTFIRNNENRNVVSSKNLKYYSEKLNKFGFLRVHKSFLVNLNHITYINNYQGNYCVLTNGDQVPISRNHFSNLKQVMNIL